SGGDRRAAVQQGIEAYDKALKLPLWLANLVGFFVERFGPKGLEYGRFSIDSHFTRNALWLRRNHPSKVAAHIPGQGGGMEQHPAAQLGDAHGWGSR
ncbi:MAG: hypothetical protein ACKOPS_14995, partial [Cyanobium sp.]